MVENPSISPLSFWGTVTHYFEVVDAFSFDKAFTCLFITYIIEVSSKEGELTRASLTS